MTPGTFLGHFACDSIGHKKIWLNWADEDVQNWFNNIHFQFEVRTVAPTILKKWPFGEKVERPSLCYTKSYVPSFTVQTYIFPIFILFDDIRFAPCFSVGSFP
jgi:hypothetical protein